MQEARLGESGHGRLSVLNRRYSRQRKFALRFLGTECESHKRTNDLPGTNMPRTIFWERFSSRSSPLANPRHRQEGKVRKDFLDGQGGQRHKAEPAQRIGAEGTGFFEDIVAV